ncbi:TPM domain-containing protein [Stenotrophomonas sp. NPDC047960]|uniref:TPM domain-containing protein n=1 Tax=Stenotrophomonas sp. NPDC047960 TaxID=3364531 RepID=UPI0037220302
MNTRLLLRVLVLLCLCLALPAWAQTDAAIPPMTSPVVDTTGTLDAAQKQALEAQALALQQRKGSQLQILMVPTTQPETIEQYAVRVFEQWKIGRKGVDDGVLLVVAKDDKRVRIEAGYGLEGAIPDAIANRVIQEYLAPRFRTGDYAGGLADGSAALVKLIDGEVLPAPVSTHRDARGSGGDGFTMALVIGFFVGTFARALLGWLPRPVRALLGGGGAAVAAFLFTSLWLASGLAGLIGLFVGFSSGRVGRFARNSGWGGGGFGGGWGGGGGGFGGGGWGGGGGRSGGGGASGGW